MMRTTSRDKRLRVTVRDPQSKTSKTVTLYGNWLTPSRIIQLVLKAVREQQKKAG